MNIRAYFYIMLAGMAALAGCAKDNFDPPTSTLTGRVVYQEQPVGLRSSGVQLELWQPGYQLNTKIPVLVDQDGSFSASLFDGDYKLVLLRGNGPWVDNSDTINVQVRGNATVDVPVQPFYVIRNERFQKSGEVISAACTVVPVVSTNPVERVTLYVGTTQFVDANNSIAAIDLTGEAITDLSQELNLSLTLPGNSTANRNYLFARIGVKTAGVAELLYTQVQKVEW